MFENGQITLISAMSETRVIGSGDGMPWNVPDEYQHFVDSVHDCVVIIGRRSFEIFGADFEAQTLVVTRQSSVDGATACQSLDQAIERAKQLDRPIFVAGGESIYRQSLDVADRMLLSTIPGDFEGDAFFPEFDPQHWDLSRSEDRSTYVLRDWHRRSR